MGVLFPVTWNVAVRDRHAPYVKHFPKNRTECSVAQYRFQKMFFSLFISSVCLFVHVTVVDKNKLTICTPLGRPRRRREDNIKMDFQEVGGGRGDWIELAQDRDGWREHVSTVKKFRVSEKCGNFLTRCKVWSASQEGFCSMEQVSK
jgi:hypothetical protein